MNNILKKLLLPSLFILMCMLSLTFEQKAFAYGLINHEQVTDVGKKHFVVLKEDGSVWMWGDNTYGQQGASGVDSSSPHPVELATGNRLSNIQAIVAGGDHTLALDQNGEVWAWGRNDYNQLGHSGGLLKNERPQKVFHKEMGKIVAIGAGGYHSLAVDESGHVWAWGLNSFGQLGSPVGLGTPPSTVEPTRVPGLVEVVSVEAGAEHSVALKRDGTVVAWGRNSLGQLGNGETASVNYSPSVVSGLSSIMEITAGDYHTIALKQDRTTVFAWGDNSYGQLGDGGREMKLRPIQVEGMRDVKTVATGANHSIAIREDGSVWMWGRHTSGTQTTRTTPIEVKGLANAVSIGGGGYDLDSYTLATKQDGTVWQWDKASSDPTTKLPIFKKVSGIDDVMKLDEFPFVQGGQVLFRYIGNTGTTDVKVNGSFNDSIDLPMIHKGGNVWELQVELKPGQYEYGFRVNGQWTVDPLNRDKTIDDFGRTFSVVKVAPYAVEGPIIDNKEVTFTYSSFDFNETLELDAKSISVSVMGNFGENYHWIEIPMVKQPNNTWKVTRTLEPRDYYYSFVVRDATSGAVAEKRNDPLNASLQTDSLTGISRNTFVVSENVLTKIPVAGITLNKGPELDLVVGEQESVIAQISPSNATNKNVNWTSSKPNIVSVDSGKLTAHSKGTATIIATTVDGGKVATITVNVTQQDNAVSYPRVGYKTFDNRYNVSPTKAWKIKFNQELDIKTFNSDSVYILNESGIKVPLGYQVTDGGKTMEIRLQSDYQYTRGATYYLFVEDTVNTIYDTKLKEKVQMQFQIQL
ncbi:RCC1 domain-containing protein [Sporosarcina obsidiansis]|uniref:RCC1 domain-containing protein n=1 Tax=Sporosarcina obsidiansis TaxID=2660748 RepID=UPI00129ADB4E|nr:Ig-like domain-containing protein [Sporosarcina obsidiansis]